MNNAESTDVDYGCFLVADEQTSRDRSLLFVDTMTRQDDSDLEDIDVSGWRDGF